VEKDEKAALAECVTTVLTETQAAPGAGGECYCVGMTNLVKRVKLCLVLGFMGVCGQLRERWI
jgi:hypothetical protein